MCPVCLASAAWIAAAAVSTGGISEFVISEFVTRKLGNNVPASNPSKEDRNG